MRWRTTALGMAAAIGVGEPVQAQVTIANTAREVGAAASDILYTGVAPFRAGARDWLSAAMLAGGFAVLLPVDDDVDRWIARHQNAFGFDVVVKPVRRSNEEFSTLATDRRLLPISGVLLLTGMVTGQRGLRDAGYGCASGWVVSNGIRAATYASVSRARPIVANGDQFDVDVPGGEWDFHSFFSGHTMNAFACVAYVNTRFKLGVAEPLLYGLASSISVARMADRLHWASDSYLGAVAGIAVGRTLALRQLRRQAQQSAADGGGASASWLDGVQVTPHPSGVAIGWRGVF